MSKFAKKSLKSEIALRQKIVGAKLKAWREQAKLSQSDVAQLLAYSTPQFVSNWERGLALPPLEVLPQLMDIYGLSAEELAGVIYRYQEQLLSEQHIALESMLRLSTKK